MNKIEFIVEKDETYPISIDIVIDNKLLSEIMKEYEYPMAKKEGSPSIAGDYNAIPLPENYKEYYLGNDTPKTMVLGCDCGIASCWPLMLKIESQDEKIIWKDFEQVHRNNWD